MNLELKNLKYWSTFYKEEADKKETRLKEFGFDKNDLFQSEECEQMFEYLIEIAQTLHLSNADESSCTIALSDLFKEKHRIEGIQFTSTQESNKLNEDLKRLNLFHETLKSDYAKLESDVANKKQHSEEIKQDIEFKQRKIEKYNYEIQKFEAYKANIDENLTHESIIDRHTKQIEIQTKLAEKQELLKEYEDLPPNICLANEKTDNIQQENIQIEKQIEKYLNII